MAQCCGACLCWTPASDLLHSPSGKNRPALPHCWIGCGRVHVTGAFVGDKAIARSNADQIYQVGFIIPLGTKPDQCHDTITPNSMYSDTSCALSGVFLLLGGFGAIMWGKGILCSSPQILTSFRVSSIIITASTDMLECCARSEALLGFSHGRHRSTSCLRRNLHCTHRCILSIWNYVSSQP